MSKESLADWDTGQRLDHSEQADFSALEFEPGCVIGKFYKIERKLGGGGMSVVYKCLDLAVDRTVAIKVLKPHLANTARGVSRLQQEARVLGRLQDPNVVTIHHLALADGGEMPYLVMDYLDGVSLADVLEREGVMNLRRCLKIVVQVVDGLVHAHELGIIHRDLKPSNIMLVNGERGPETVKILDFGIAKIVYPQYEVPANITQTGEIFGSPAYMSPEQGLGKAVDSRSDQYSLGCMIYECLTGAPPHVGRTAMETLLRHVSDDPVSLGEASLGATFPPAVEVFVGRLLNKEPSERFASMVDVREELTTLLDPSQAASDHEIIAIPKMAKQNPLIAGVAAGIVGLIVVCISAIVLFDRPAPSEDRRSKSMQHAHSTGEEATDNTRFPPRDYSKIPESIVIDQVDADTRLGKFISNDLYIKSLRMNLNFRQITDKGMVYLKRLPNLRDLDVSKCPWVTDEGMKQLSGMKLDTLRLSWDELSDGAISNLLPVPRLQDLYFDHDHGITSKSMAYLRNMPRLVSLDIADTSVNGAGLSELARVKTLHRIDLSKLHIRNGLPSLLALPKLQRLDLDGTDVQDEDLLVLLKMKALRTLSLSNTKITDAGLDTLAKMHQLDCIILCECSGVSSSRLSRLRRELGDRVIVSKRNELNKAHG